MLHMLVILTSLTVFESAARDDQPPSKETLAAMTKRGQGLAKYDQAAWHASDAIQARQVAPGRVTRYIARETDKGWVVAFGRLDDEKEAFLIAYLATEGSKPDRFEVKALEPPTRDTGYFLAAAKGIDTALADFTEHFEGSRRPYNVAVLPAEKDQLWVYLVPAPTVAGVWPLGGDVRYLLSKDGTKIVAKRQLHKSVIELPPPKADENRQVAGIHTHVLDNVPEDTDVFHVLSRKPAVPEMVVTGKFLFQVETDGTINYVGKTDEKLKK